MELWIRSQDKMKLVKVDYTEYNYSRTTNINSANIDYHKIITFYGDNCITLGTYKTKERALEVLDEIQSLIETNFECCYNKKVDAYFDCNDVYEMPEE